MKKLLSLLTAFFFLSIAVSTAQTGTVRGTIYEDASGMTIPFASVVVKETGSGTTSDLDGAYELNLAPGTYTVTVSYIGFADYNLSELVVADGKTEVIDIRLAEESQVLNEIVVTAKQARTSEAALATIKRRSTNLLDGISSQTFEKIGDSNAGEALKRVTGVSVVGGKHVYVRGLGDRYTKTILNGMDIPGLDPDKNSFEMDLLPTNLIDNILVYKSFTPNLPGDFTGGIVDVVTKDFPEERFMNISAGIGYNPSMHFNSNYIHGERSGTDALAFDDGLRELKLDPNQEIPDPTRRDNLTSDLTRKFGDNQGILTGTNNLNKSISFATGNQVKRGDVKMSYIFSANYKNKSSFYEGAEFDTYIYDEQNNPGQFKLTQDVSNTGNIGQESALWSTLAGGAIKIKNHRFALQAMRIQNGISKASQQRVNLIQSSDAILRKQVVEYAQREVTNFNLMGKHLVSEGKLEVNWKLAPTFITVDEPDIRYSAFEERDGDLIIAPAVGADVTRTWRNLQETNYAGKLDLKYTITDDNVIKLGFSGTHKSRDFGIQNYLFRVINQSELNLNGDPNNIFNEENIWTPEKRIGTYVKGNFEASNTFDATQQVLAAYVMNELTITPTFKAIYGVRAEKADNHYTGTNNGGTISYNDEKVLDEFNILPSINLVYNLGEKTNLRGSYNRTVARPSFKEKSIAQIQDRISGRTFIGNIDLKQTDIDNFDLRYETFATGGQTFAVSGFYKRFTNPVELESFSDRSPSNFIPRNIAEKADVYGVEVEVLKRLDILSPSLNKFTVGTNVTLVKSEVERSNAADLPAEEKMRPMAGQSPYIVNASLGYNDVETGLEVNAGYNVQGKRLFIAGFGSNADVYDMPFHSLNLKASKKFGKENRYKLSLGADNLLGDDREKEYQAFSGDTGIFERLSPGRTISLSVSAKLF